MFQIDPRLISFVENNPGRINFVLQLHCTWIKKLKKQFVSSNTAVQFIIMHLFYIRSCAGIQTLQKTANLREGLQGITLITVFFIAHVVIYILYGVNGDYGENQVKRFTVTFVNR